MLAESVAISNALPPRKRKRIARAVPQAERPGMSGRKTAEESAQTRIAELERALEAIRRKDRLMTESQSAVSRILAAAPVIIYVYDLSERKNVYINREVTDILGYSTEQLQAMGTSMLSTLIHPEDLPIAIQHHARLVTTEAEEILQVRYRMKSARGDWRWFVSSDSPFEKEPGQATRFIIGCAQEMPD